MCHKLGSVLKSITKWLCTGFTIMQEFYLYNIPFRRQPSNIMYLLYNHPAIKNKKNGNQSIHYHPQLVYKTTSFQELFQPTLLWIINIYVGWDSAVGIAMCFRLDGLGVKLRWKRDFPHLSRPALGPTQPPTQCVPGHPRG